MSPSNDENGTYFLFLTPVTPAQMHPAAGLLARETPTGGGTLLPIPAPPTPVSQLRRVGGGEKWGCFEIKVAAVRWPRT